MRHRWQSVEIHCLRSKELTIHQQRMASAQMHTKTDHPHKLLKRLGYRLQANNLHEVYLKLPDGVLMVKG